jgi:starch synthase
MRVLQVCAEIYPLLKTGGLADVAGALPAALQGAGAEVRVLLPGFEAVMAGLKEPVTVGELAPMAACRARGCSMANCRRGLPRLCGRPGALPAARRPYADAQQQPYADNHLRFARLGWAAAELAGGIDGYWRPELVHAHDWHAALAPACMKAMGVPVARSSPSTTWPTRAASTPATSASWACRCTSSTPRAWSSTAR